MESFSFLYKIVKIGSPNLYRNLLRDLVKVLLSLEFYGLFQYLLQYSWYLKMPLIQQPQQKRKWQVRQRNPKHHNNFQETHLFNMFLLNWHFSFFSEIRKNELTWFFSPKICIKQTCNVWLCSSTTSFNLLQKREIHDGPTLTNVRGPWDSEIKSAGT